MARRLPQFGERYVGVLLVRRNDQQLALPKSHLPRDALARKPGGHARDAVARLDRWSYERTKFARARLEGGVFLLEALAPGEGQYLFNVRVDPADESPSLPTVVLPAREQRVL